MSNFDEIKSLNLFGGNEGENKNEEAIGGEMIGTVDAKGKPLDSILEMLSQMRDPSTDDADDDFDNDDNVMDADDYHNKACDMARRGNYKRASNFCMEGLKRYPNLVSRDVTSLRKHQQMIEAVLENALNIALIQDTEEVVAVTEDMFAEAEIAVLGAVKHRVGF